MQKLKCIGGECDGYTIDKNELKLHDQISVRKKIEYKISNFPNDIKEITGETLNQHSYMYKVCSISCTHIDGKVLRHLYLCPADWHEWKALMYQFGK